MTDDNLSVLNQNPEESNKKKDIRMHVMPEDIFKEDELYKKINQKSKLSAESRESLKTETTENLDNNLVEEKKKPKEIPKNELKRPIAKKGKTKTKVIVLSVFILILLSAAAFAGYYYWEKSNQKLVNDNLSNIEKKQDLDEKLKEEEARKQEEEAQKLAEEEQLKIERDKTRIKDIIELQRALKDYYAQNKTYLADLSEDSIKDAEGNIYLENIPEDPLNQDDYKYDISLAKDNYEITFTLEENYNELAAGSHTVSNKLLLTLDGKMEIAENKDIEKELVILVANTDNDLDGLSDLEEELFKSNPNKFDSDEDSYTDHQELLNLYSPSNPAPTTLLEAGLVQNYKSENLGYELFYPSNWELQKLDPEDLDITFVPTKGDKDEFIELKVFDNTGELSLNNWIEIQMQKTKKEYEAKYYSKDFISRRGKIKGIWIEELFKIYFASKDKVYELSYNFDIHKPLSYKSVFEMMAKSFLLDKTVLDENNVLNTDDIDYDKEYWIVEGDEDKIDESINTEENGDNEEIINNEDGDIQNTDEENQTSVIEENQIDKVEENSDDNNIETENPDNAEFEEFLDDFYAPESSSDTEGSTNPDEEENNTES